jgi:16S rRNA (uracil1498-N3)-methyltransferase
VTTDADVPDLDGAPLFLLDTLPGGDELLVDGAEGRHAVDVLRLEPGETVRVGDGRGAVAEGSVVAAGPQGLRVAVSARFEVPAPQPEFVLVQALPKGDRGPLAVDLATELGVDRIVPWTAARCVTRWREDRVAKGVAKWRAAARAASKQSRRPRVPEVTGRPMAGLTVPGSGVVAVVVGPEGGLTDGEVVAFRAAGAEPVRLGPEVLRTSTAGAAALAALSARTRWS